MGTAQRTQCPAWHILSYHGGSIHPQRLQAASPISLQLGDGRAGPLISLARIGDAGSVQVENVVTICFNPIEGNLLLASGTHSAPLTPPRSCHFLTAVALLNTHTHTPHPSYYYRKSPDTL